VSWPVDLVHGLVLEPPDKVTARLYNREFNESREFLFLNNQH
jgi:hypothetical protein